MDELGERRMSEDKGIRTTRLYVAGMACAFCASTIERGLAKLNGVKSAKVSLETGEVFVRHDSSVSPEVLRRELERLGYYVFEGKRDSVSVLRDSKRRSLSSWGLSSISLLLTLPMMVKAYALPAYSFYVNVAVVSAALFYSALPIHRGALNALRRGILNEHVLYGVSGISAYVLGLLGVLYPGLREFLLISALLTSLHLTAGWMGAYLRYKVEESLSKIVELRPPVAHLANGEDVPVTRLREGDMVVVKPGEKVPLDGVVVNGESEVSEAVITGESEPVLKRTGDVVIGGSTNGSGHLVVRVATEYSGSFLSRILGVVEEVKRSKPSVLTFFERIVDRVWVPLVLTISLLTLLGWGVYGALTGHDLSFYLFRGVVSALLVSVIGYPCAIGFSSPAMGLSLFERYLRAGVMLKGVGALERLSEVRTVVLDKTGTLTYGQPVVRGFRGEGEALVYAYSVERFSSHPIARAITLYAEGEGVEPLEVTNFRELPGKGVVGEVEGNEVFVGRIGVTNCEAPLNGNVVICINGKLAGQFDVEDDLRRDAAEFVRRLKVMGMRVVMLSGDRGDKVRALAERLGIPEYYAEMSPERKVEVVRELKGREEGGVLMLGDGVNDSASLALADVSVAMGSAVDLSKNVADIVLLNNDLQTLLSILERRGRASKAIPSNVTLALLYNAVGIPLAVLGALSGLLAMVIMALSLASVFVNARLSALYA
jgi:heavy metal translocating P-type ATPase